MNQWQNALAIGAMMSASFLLGQWAQIGGAKGDQAGVVGSEHLLAFSRAAENPQQPGGGGGQPQQPTVVYPEDAGQASSANGFLAVTGSYGVGTSVLYLVDTVNRQLAVYEARGGSPQMRRVVLVGARKLDLDLKLEGYNDQSEYDYRKLRKAFENRGNNDPEISTGLQPSNGEAADGR